MASTALAVPRPAVDNAQILLKSEDAGLLKAVLEGKETHARAVAKVRARVELVEAFNDATTTIWSRSAKRLARACCSIASSSLRFRRRLAPVFGPRLSQHSIFIRGTTMTEAAQFTDEEMAGSEAECIHHARQSAVEAETEWRRQGKVVAIVDDEPTYVSPGDWDSAAKGQEWQ